MHVNAKKATFPPVPAQNVTSFHSGKDESLTCPRNYGRSSTCPKCYNFTTREQSTHSSPVESTPQPTIDMMWLLMKDQGINWENIPPV